MPRADSYSSLYPPPANQLQYTQHEERRSSDKTPDL